MLEQEILGAFAKIAPSGISKIANLLKKPIDEIRVRITNVFSDHVRVSIERCSHVKTIISDEKPVLIDDIYVNLNLKDKSNKYTDEDLTNNIEKFSKLIIKGTAGSGKTMLMKYLTIKEFQRGERIPIFIDLRDIKSPREMSFIRSVFDLCTPDKSNSEYDIFNAGLNEGVFSFFFDGLDEINPEYQPDTFRQMQRFPIDYPRVKTVISSRPETETMGFSIFNELTLDDFNIDQSCQLIEKTNYHDITKKELFLSKLRSGEFSDRETFTKIPLLCLLMFMTFSDAGEVPERAALFYDQAFDTLYSRHDSSKGPFRRIHRSSLQKDQFRRVFRIFCYRTLVSHLISFDNIQIFRHLSRSLEIESLDCNVDDLKRDCLESVCLLQRDGGKIYFIHRSFQEYFAADFLANYRGANQFEIFDKVLNGTTATILPSLLKDIDIAVFEQIWILPTIEKLQDLMKGKSKKNTPIEKMIGNIQVMDSDGTIISKFYMGEDSIFSVIGILAELYDSSEFPLPQLRFNNVKAYPENYGSFRDFVKQSASAPQEFKIQLEKETNLIRMANETRKSMTQHIINIWEIDMNQNDAKRWLKSLIIPDIIPEIRIALITLHKIVCDRVEKRSKLNILE